VDNLNERERLAEDGREVLEPLPLGESMAWWKGRPRLKARDADEGVP
jgi:hypothetical protein